MRRIAILLLLAWPAPAGEQDAAIAHPHRWSDPYGTPAGARRSACLPLTSDVEEAWSVDLPGPAVSPVVYWEREAYLACRDGDRYVLVAVDVFEGELSARETLPKDAPSPLPVVWEGRVYLRRGPLELSEFVRSGRTFTRRWSHEPAERTLGDPIVFENEIYVIADGDLVRLRPRWKSPIWRVGAGHLGGRPALYGDHVYALQRKSGIEMHVGAYRRRGGVEDAWKDVAHYARSSAAQTRPRISVTEKTLILRGPGAFSTTAGKASHVMVDRDASGARLRIGTKPSGFMNFPVEPAMTPLGLLVLAKAKITGWGFFVDERRYRIFASDDDNPDLFDRKRLVAPTVLGEIVYFGSWAADLRTGDILWRLPVKEMSFPAVPLDRMVIVVDGKTKLLAFRPRGSKS